MAEMTISTSEIRMRVTMTSQKGNWTPRRSGETFCSPMCGGHCTWAQHQLATKRGKALAATLGHGWKPVVWENLGWHYRAEWSPTSNAQFTIHSTAQAGFWCSLMVARYQICSRGMCTTPKRALYGVLKKVHQMARQLTAIIEAIKKPLPRARD